jgi:hypothetical protein
VIQTIEADADELLTALSTLTELAKRLPQLFDGLVHVSELGSELACIESADLTALGTSVGKLRVRLKPTDRLLKLVAALQACERELLIAKELAHV